jgi:hypothetical protein
MSNISGRGVAHERKAIPYLLLGCSGRTRLALSYVTMFLWRELRISLLRKCRKVLAGSWFVTGTSRSVLMSNSLFFVQLVCMVTAVIEPRWIDNIDTHQHLLPTHNEVDGHLLQTRNSPPLPRSLGLWVQCSRARKRGCVPVRPGQREVRYSLNYRHVDVEDKYVWAAN